MGSRWWAVSGQTSAGRPEWQVPRLPMRTWSWPVTLAKPSTAENIQPSAEGCVDLDSRMSSF